MSRSAAIVSALLSVIAGRPVMRRYSARKRLHFRRPPRCGKRLFIIASQAEKWCQCLKQTSERPACNNTIPVAVNKWISRGNQVEAQGPMRGK